VIVYPIIEEMENVFLILNTEEIKKINISCACDANHLYSTILLYFWSKLMSINIFLNELAYSIYKICNIYLHKVRVILSCEV
jgi:hypothetical protein